MATTQAAALVRLRADRCFYADPPPATPSPKGGRPRTHGAKFACKDPTTWPAPTAERTVEDEQYSTVRVRAWAGPHPKQQNHPGRGTRQPRPVVRGTVVLVEVGRLPARPYQPKALWLRWAGPGALDLDLLWRAYVRRFDLEHTLRFCKQGLGWTTPRVRHPERADRWTWLVVAAYTQLRLARPWVADHRLPWERPLDPDKLTPARVRRALAGPTQGESVRARHPLPGPEESRVRHPMSPSYSTDAATAAHGETPVRSNHKLRTESSAGGCGSRPGRRW